jgi:hypothetical protein
LIIGSGRGGDRRQAQDRSELRHPHAWRMLGVTPSCVGCRDLRRKDWQKSAFPRSCRRRSQDVV